MSVRFSYLWYMSLDHTQTLPRLLYLKLNSGGIWSLTSSTTCDVSGTLITITMMRTDDSSLEADSQSRSGQFAWSKGRQQLDTVLFCIIIIISRMQ